MLKMLNAHNAMRTVLENRRITLELALRQLAQTVGGQAPDQEEIAAFFHDFMDGYWDAFAEATAHNTTKLKQADVQSQELQKQILQQLDPAHRELFGEYEALLYSRTTTEVEQAFLVGYQTAIRFLLMGILPLQTFTNTSGVDSEEKGDVQNET